MSALTAAQRAAAAGLELTVLRRLDGLLQGDHGGLLPGHGSETGEARLYAAGDDTRRIDWSLTARTQSLMPWSLEVTSTTGALLARSG